MKEDLPEPISSFILFIISKASIASLLGNSG